MYCYTCGRENPEWAKFCCSCGKEQPSVNKCDGPSGSGNCSSSSSTDTSTKVVNKLNAAGHKVLTFAEYKKRKSESRSSFLSKAKKSKEEKHAIQIGLIKFDTKSKKLKAACGRLAVEVLTNATASTILTAAVEKYSAFEQSFDKDCEYVLLYPDGSEVINVPGSSVPFELGQYKKASGRPYSRVTLFLGTRKDVLFDRLPKAEDFILDSESDESVSDVDTQERITSYFQKKSFNPIDPNVPQSAIDTSADKCSIDLTTNIPDHSSNISINHSTDHEDLPKVNISSATGDVSTAEIPDTHTSDIMCPICFLPFSVCDIAEHVDVCNNWQPEVTSDNDERDLTGSDLFGEEFPEQSFAQGDQVLKSSEDIKLSLKNTIKLLSDPIAEQERVRINVRRKYLWVDFKKACEKKIKPHDNIKVVFVGESAIDDGGPRREFFTGICIFASFYCFTKCNFKIISMVIFI